MGTFSVRLPVEIEERLNKLSVQTGRTKAFYVRQALLKHLEDLEDYFKTKKAMEHVRNDENALSR